MLAPGIEDGSEQLRQLAGATEGQGQNGSQGHRDDEGDEGRPPPLVVLPEKGDDGRARPGLGQPGQSQEDPGQFGSPSLAGQDREGQSHGQQMPSPWAMLLSRLNGPFDAQEAQR